MKKVVYGMIIFAICTTTLVFASNEHDRYVATEEVESKLQELPPTPVATSTSIRIPILIYHSVRPTELGDTATQKEFDVPPDIFEKQLQYLKQHGYRAITIDELAHDVAVGTTSSQKLVALTFDDGWENQYQYAFPLLKKYNDIATFYIYTNPISKDPRFLTWQQVEELSAAGMLIGSHTLSHPYLNKLSPQQLHDEIFESKKILEAHLGKPVDHFASPFGYSDANVESLVKEAGYTTARTTYRGTYHSKADELQLTGYFTPQGMSDFIWLLNFAP